MENNKRIEWLEKLDCVKYYISFSAKSGTEQHQIIKDYNIYIALAKDSKPGKLYQASRTALKENNMAEVKRLGVIAREMLADNDFEPAPQPFDPSFIGNKTQVQEYRQRTAKRDEEIPEDFKETLL